MDCKNNRENIIIDTNILLYMKKKLAYLNSLLKEFNIYVLNSTICEIKDEINLDALNYTFLNSKILNVDQGILHLNGYSILTNDKRLGRALKKKGTKVYKISHSKYIRS